MCLRANTRRNRRREIRELERSYLDRCRAERELRPKTIVPPKMGSLCQLRDKLSVNGRIGGSFNARRPINSSTQTCYAAPRSLARSEEAVMSTKVEVLNELVELINQRREVPIARYFTEDFRLDDAGTGVVRNGHAGARVASFASFDRTLMTRTKHGCR